MIAADTNVLLRLLVQDDAVQEARARALVEDVGVLVLDVVMMELAWVLGSYYKVPREKVAAALMGLLETQGIEPETPSMVAALGWYARGMDFGDAVILAAANRNMCDEVATFDERFISRAREEKACKVVLVPA